MRVECIGRLSIVTTVRTQVGNGPGGFNARRRIRCVGVRFIGPVRELKREPVVLAFLDDVQFFGGVGIRPVVCREHASAIVPTKSISVPEAAGVNFDFRIVGLWIKPPKTGREWNFTALVVAFVSPSFVSIGARAAAHINKAVWSDGNVSDAMVKRSNTPRVSGPEPRFRKRGLSFDDGSCAKDGDVIGYHPMRFVALVRYDIKALLRIERQPDGAWLAILGIDVIAAAKDLFDLAAAHFH